MALDPHRISRAPIALAQIRMEQVDSPSEGTTFMAATRLSRAFVRDAALSVVSDMERADRESWGGCRGAMASAAEGCGE